MEFFTRENILIRENKISLFLLVIGLCSILFPIEISMVLLAIGSSVVGIAGNKARYRNIDLFDINTYLKPWKQFGIKLNSVEMTMVKFGLAVAVGALVSIIVRFIISLREYA